VICGLLANVQVVDLATHISRSLPTASDANASREYITSVESSLGEGEDVEQGKRVEIVKGLVAKVNEGRGALEGTKESGMLNKHGHGYIWCGDVARAGEL
jgi:translation initiation factor 3 subunit M